MLKKSESVQVESYPVQNTEGMWIVQITDSSSRNVLHTIAFLHRPTPSDIIDVLDAKKLGERTADRTELIKDWTVEQCDYFVAEEERLRAMGFDEDRAEQVAYYEAAGYYRQKEGAGV